MQLASYATLDPAQLQGIYHGKIMAAPSAAAAAEILSIEPKPSQTDALATTLPAAFEVAAAVADALAAGQ